MSITQETIICPRCHSDQAAEIEFEDWMPFPCFVHTCTSCGYVIMESEWDRKDKLK